MPRTVRLHRLRSAVVGNHDVAFARLAPVPLTTVAHPVAGIGEAAVDRLIERIEGRARTPERILLRPELRIRRSCGCNRTDRDDST